MVVKMEKTFNYKPTGVCSRNIKIVLDDNIIKNVEFTGGCSGNAQGLSALVKGSEIDDVIKRLKGIDCYGKGTSCPDQLALALEKVKNS